MEHQHLSEEEIAMASEATVSNNYDALPESIKNHIAGCDNCASEVIAITEIIENENIEVIESKNYIKESKLGLNRFLKIGISIAALLLLALGLHYIFNYKNSEESNIAENNDTTKIIQEQKQIAIENETPAQVEEKKPDDKEKVLMAFNENPKLEQLYQRYQNNSMRGDEIEIKSPDVIQFSDSAATVLKWKNLENEDLNIEVFNNFGAKIMSLTTNENSIQLAPLKQEGLYYWKLFDSDYELLYCGKIIYRTIVQ